RLIPAEWALTVSAWLSKTCMLQLSGGTALPLSSERVDFGQGNSKLEHFAGLGAPEARVVTLLRVVTPDPGLSENSLLHEGHGHDDDRGATLGRGELRSASARLNAANHGTRLVAGACCIHALYCATGPDAYRDPNRALRIRVDSNAAAVAIA